MTDEQNEWAEKGRVAALLAASDWLKDKAEKCRLYPGADLKDCNARADAYDNASMTLRRWAQTECG